MNLVEAALREQAERERLRAVPSPVMWTGPLPPMPQPTVTLESATREFRRQFIAEALKRNAGDQRATAIDLGIGYSTLKAELRRMRMA